MKHWISKPNSCRGCPVAKLAPLGAKISNICHLIQMRYEVECRLNDLGKQICIVTKR